MLVERDFCMTYNFYPQKVLQATYVITIAITYDLRLFFYFFRLQATYVITIAITYDLRLLFYFF